MHQGDQQGSHTSNHSLAPLPLTNYNTVLSQTPIPITSVHRESVGIAFDLNATTPPLTDPQTTMQRADEINTVQQMFSNAQTSAVMLIGTPGTGKSTLAALLFRRLQMAKNSGMAAPKYMVWLTIGTYTTLPNIIAAILAGVGMPDSGLFLLKPEQQVSSLLRALRRPSESALIVLDQFELLLHPETNQGVAGRGALPLFLDMLQTDLGSSRILLTGYHSPYDENKISNPRVRSYLVTRISLPEGVALLQQRGVHGSPEEVSFVWQRCAGHAYALVLCSALIQLSGITLNQLLNAPEYRPLWSGDVIANLIVAIHYFLNPTQNAVIHALSLFHEPVPQMGIFMTITGDTIEAQQRQGQEQVVAAFEHELQTLTRVGIIQIIANKDNTPAYTLHPLLRQYTLEHFMEDISQDGQDGKVPPWPDKNPKNPGPEQSEQQQSALIAGHVQVAAYYEHMINILCPPREQRVGLQDIGPIITTIRHLCLGHRWQHACGLLFQEGLHENMVQWGAWNTLIGLYTAMLPPFGTLKPQDAGMVSSHVGMLYGRIGEHQQSKAYFDQALALQRRVNDHHGEAVTLTNQGELLRMRGEQQQARQNFETALKLMNDQPDLQLKSVALHNLGLLSQQERDYTQAYNDYVEALKLAALLRHQHYTGMILTNLGMLLYEQRQPKEALAILFAALHIRHGLQDPTAPLLERFLVAIEQKMGSEKYTRLCTEALEVQPEVLSRFVAPDMRQ